MTNRTNYAGIVIFAPHGAISNLRERFPGAKITGRDWPESLVSVIEGEFDGTAAEHREITEQVEAMCGE